MRAIDNYTDKEREVLASGSRRSMTAPRTASERTRPTCDCGAEGDWHGPHDGRRVFACDACYASQGAAQ